MPTMGKTDTSAKPNKDPRRVLTETARGSYLHVFKPTTFKNKTTYSAVLLFDKESTDMASIIRAKNAALKEVFGPKETWPKGLDNPIRDGDKPKFADKEGYKGHWVVKATASEEFKPGVYGMGGEELVKASSIVSGDYVRAQIYAIAWDTAGNRGSSFLLDGIQLVEKGEPLSARGALKFDPVAGHDSDESDESDEDEESDDEEVDFS
jgi:hypothetical protein